MADKTSTGAVGTAPTQSNVSTAGTIAADTASIIFDDASRSVDISDAIERAKVQAQDYYNKR